MTQPQLAPRKHRLPKPSTKFVRHKRQDEHLTDLAICYQNLLDVCELFDQGHRFISALIAVEIAKLVANEGRDQSPVLLRVARAKEIQFSSSPEEFSLPPGYEIAGKYNLLVQETIRTMEAPHGVNMVRSSVPRCWEYARHNLWPTWDTIPYEQWWEGMVVMSKVTYREWKVIQLHAARADQSHQRCARGALSWGSSRRRAAAQRSQRLHVRSWLLRTVAPWPESSACRRGTTVAGCCPTDRRGASEYDQRQQPCWTTYLRRVLLSFSMSCWSSLLAADEWRGVRGLIRRGFLVGRRAVASRATNRPARTSRDPCTALRAALSSASWTLATSMILLICHPISLRAGSCLLSCPKCTTHRPEACTAFHNTQGFLEISSE